MHLWFVLYVYMNKDILKYCNSKKGISQKSKIKTQGTGIYQCALVDNKLVFLHCELFELWIKHMIFYSPGKINLTCALCHLTCALICFIIKGDIANKTFHLLMRHLLFYCLIVSNHSKKTLKFTLPCNFNSFIYYLIYSWILLQLLFPFLKGMQIIHEVLPYYLLKCL